MVIALSQLFSSILMVRFLGEEGVGILAIASGAFSMVSVLNLSWESILLRSNAINASNESELQDYFSKFIFFNCLKSCCILILTYFLGIYIADLYQNANLLWAILSYCMVCILDIMVSPFSIFSSTQYKQKLVTIMVMLRWLIHLVFLFGFLKWPSLKYAFVKECVLSIIIIISWIYIGRKQLRLNLSFKKFTKDDWGVLKKDLAQFGLWTHLTGVSAQILYRVDALVLALFAPISIVGQYGIALSAANAAYIIPSVLSYQNSIVNSQISSDFGAKKVTEVFFRVSGIIGVMTFLIYIVFGNWYLTMMTKQKNNPEIFQYMVAIVIGVLIIKTLVSSLVSYINSRGNVKRLFLFVSLPTLIIGIAIYTLGGFWKQGLGISLANIAVALLWLSLSLIEMRRYGFSFRSLLSWKEDYALLQYMRKQQ